MKVTILLGSMRLERQSHKAAYFIKHLLTARNIETDLIDLSEDPLPIMEERAGYHPQLPAKVQEISRRLQEGDALLLITPEYHGSFSGVLKNALDYFWSEFHKKPVGVVAVSGGKMGGINASVQLQHVILSMGAYPLPLKLLVPEIHHAFSDNFEPQRENTVRSAGKFLDEFLWFALAIMEAKNTTEQILN